MLIRDRWQSDWCECHFQSDSARHRAPQTTCWDADHQDKPRAPTLSTRTVAGLDTPDRDRHEWPCRRKPSMATARCSVCVASDHMQAAQFSFFWCCLLSCKRVAISQYFSIPPPSPFLLICLNLDGKFVVGVNPTGLAEFMWIAGVSERTAAQRLVVDDCAVGPNATRLRTWIPASSAHTNLFLRTVRAADARCNSENSIFHSTLVTGRLFTHHIALHTDSRP